MGLSLWYDVTKLLKKHNAAIRRATTIRRYTPTVFVKPFNKELTKHLLKHMHVCGTLKPYR